MFGETLKLRSLRSKMSSLKLLAPLPFKITDLSSEITCICI